MSVPYLFSGYSFLHFRNLDIHVLLIYKFQSQFVFPTSIDIYKRSSI